jgi:UDP-N-acetylmuramoylalanine--D-glutamate ligase
MTFSGKQIAVFGMQRSGVAVAKLLDDLGAKVRVTDQKSVQELRSIVEALKDRSIELILGGHDRRCIDQVDMVVVSPGVRLDIPILQEARSKGISIVGELEVAASVCPAPIVAITGTKGKSTTTVFTASILKDGNFRKVRVAGNIGIPLSSEVQDLTSEDLVVVEASSFQLETTMTFHPMVSVILNLSRDHLDQHGTLEAYRAAKLKISAHQTSEDWTVLNAEDPVIAAFAAETRAKTVYFTTNSSPAGLGTYVRNDKVFAYWDGESHCVLTKRDIPLAGNHNLRNVLAAVAVGEILGITPHQMRSTIRRFSPAEYPALEHAFETVNTINGVQFINDSKATNVAAVTAALESLSNPILLIMGGYDKGNSYQPLVECVQSKVKELVLLGSHTGIIRNALAAHVVTWEVGTMIDAVELAYSHAVPGDVVLLSPANASFDMFTDYKARGQAFREAVNHLESTEPTSKSDIHLDQLSN